MLILLTYKIFHKIKKQVKGKAKLVGNLFPDREGKMCGGYDCGEKYLTAKVAKVIEQRIQIKEKWDKLFPCW